MLFPYTPGEGRRTVGRRQVSLSHIRENMYSVTKRLNNRAIWAYLANSSK